MMPVGCEVIDLTGLLCPLVVLRLAERVRTAPAGHRAIVLSDDPLSAIDIPVFARRNGFVVIGPEAAGGVLRFELSRE